jgi:hypothetical protein
VMEPSELDEFVHAVQHMGAFSSGLVPMKSVMEYNTSQLGKRSCR